MATESDVDIRSAHPYWAYPYSDIAVVHNGQITNYWLMRRQLEREGQRFVSNCDSELLAVYVATSLEKGMTLEDTLQKSIDEIDGVFTYLVTTKDQLGHGQGLDGCQAHGSLRDRRHGGAWRLKKSRSAQSFPTKSIPGIPMTRR